MNDEPIIVKPFGDGRILARGDIEALLRRALGEGAELHPALLLPSSPRSTLVRMLTNLKTVYASKGDHTRAFVAIDRIVSLVPDSARMLRERAGVALKLGIQELARAALTRVLELEPQAPDAPMIQKRLRASHVEEVRAELAALVRAGPRCWRTGESTLVNQGGLLRSRALAAGTPAHDPPTGGEFTLVNRGG